MNVLILNALMTRLSTPALSGSPPIASPFVAYSPVTGTKYLQAHDPLRAEPDPIGVAFNSATILRGIFQVDAVAPDGAGSGPGLTLAGLVAARFPRGLELVIAPYKLQFLQVPTIAAAVKDAPWVRFPVSIPYLVIT